MTTPRLAWARAMRFSMTACWSALIVERLGKGDATTVELAAICGAKGYRSPFWNWLHRASLVAKRLRKVTGARGNTSIIVWGKASVTIEAVEQGRSQ